jgi:outer membrane protein assembly factor BamB
VRDEAVLITTVCPFCEQRWRVDDSLRGRQLRCPNAGCRQVFEVRAAEAPPEAPIEGVPVPPAPDKPKTGQVGDMVPVVSAEAVQPTPPPPPDWRSAPPPQRAGGTVPAAPPKEPTPPPARPPQPPPSTRDTPPPRKKRKAPAEQKSRKAERPDEEPRESSDGPVELPPGTWDAPPVRGGGDGGAVATRGRSRTALEMEAAENRARAKKRRNTRAMLGMVAGLVLVLGGVGLLGWLWLQGRETRDREAADKLYADGQYAQASGAYDKLLEKYPDSPNGDDYKFWRELSAIRAMPSALNARGGFDRIGSFLETYKGDLRFTEHGKEVGDVIAQLLNDASDRALKDPHDEDIQKDIKSGLKVLNELLALNHLWVPDDAIAKFNDNKAKWRQAIQDEEERRALLARLQSLAEKPTADSIRQVQEILHQEAEKRTKFNADPDVIQVVNALHERFKATIAFTKAQEDDPPRKPVSEDPGQSMLVQPVLAIGGVGPALPADRVFFALARGVLYGLRQDSGDIVWAMRVGIDTHQLPLRVPRQGNAPELALVLSTDTLTFTAVDAGSGATLWTHRLGAACLGRPVIVDRRAYVPLLNGEVEEVELSGGGLLGRYKLGQSLSVGGTRFDDDKRKKKLIFFPGDDSCVYVLDATNRSCEAVLYTDHEAGTLRGEPIVLPSEENPSVPGYLVLCQAHGLDATLLRTFRLLQPVPSPDAEPGSPESRLRVEPVAMPERRLRGQPWFPPFRDPEKLITVTDAGVLGLFGINQKLNKDDPLFPLVRRPDQEEGTIELPGQGVARGRAQVVFARGNDLWVLARGRLLRYTLALRQQDGPQVLPDSRWERPLDLGSPLHESQLDDAETTLFLVTQSPNGKACLATAVDTETGQVRWQRQLGLVCHGDPRPLGDQVVALDQGGGLFGFRANKHLEDSDWQWQSAGHLLAPPLPKGTSGSVYFVPGPDGKSVFQFNCPDPGTTVIVREFRAGRGQASEATIGNLPARLAGTPAVGTNRILLPLGNGDTRQVHLEGKEGTSKEGPMWRATHGDTAARGHVVWLGGDDFLTTNGRRGLTRWRFRADDVYNAVPADSDARKPTVQLPEEIAGSPLVLSLAGEGSKLRVCVADDRGTVYLFEGDALKLARQWPLQKSLTAGPFLRDGRIGCVVGRRKLVWLDPAKDKPLWQYESPGEAIIGRPQVADGMVLVADVTGRFVGLDPATGKARGPGYQLRASVGPAAAPAGFSAERAFAPLTDGTVLLLSLRYLREPLPGLPPVW